MIEDKQHAENLGSSVGSTDCQDSAELLSLLGNSQIFTKDKRIEVAFYTHEEAYRFRNLIWSMRKAAKLSQ